MSPRAFGSAFLLGLSLWLGGPSRVEAAPPAPAAHSGDETHGGAHEDHEAAPINWYYGLLGEKQGTAPNLLYRAPGMPVPFLAPLLNLLVLVGLGWVYGRKPIAEALRKRRETIMREMEEGARIKAAAQERFEKYRARHLTMQSEMERIRAEARQQTAADKDRALREADEKRERFRRDAALLLEQERKETRQRLLEKAVQLATQRAESLLTTALADADQARLLQTYLGDIKQMSQSKREELL